MRFQDLIEQTPVGTIGSTPAPTSAAPTGTAPNLSGNVDALQDPRMQAANLAKQKQEKEQQKRSIQAQIAALQKQLADLNRTA